MLSASDGGLARFALGEAVSGTSAQMERIKVAAQALTQGEVGAIMVQQDHRLHSGDSVLMKSELRLAVESIQGLAQHVAQESADMKRYNHHLGALVTQAWGGLSPQSIGAGVTGCTTRAFSVCTQC